MMHRSKKPRPLCAHLHEDDGFSPRHDRKDTERSHDRKDLQLCKQVQRALEMQLSSAGWASDAALRIEGVTPHPDASRLRVRVSWDDRGMGLAGVLALLTARRAELRWAVASAITRKRAPELVFEASPRIEEGDTDAH